MAGLYAALFKKAFLANGKRSPTMGWFYSVVGGALCRAF
ncbi:hypothetical protein PCIT_a1618 [Pseudoalteromonas citrea]|uniref:Uncharacterized protein n=1 Tax=Pseudoalteromonas citrea TaxID=43655 RepID=A0AAD4AMM1_9GAMM|nr:hypothetical protein PCIT_a1618 [Pseudoalteromonas citrea]